MHHPGRHLSVNSYKPRYFIPLSHCRVVELVITVSGFLIIRLISRLMVTRTIGQGRIMPWSLMTELISLEKSEVSFSR